MARPSYGPQARKQASRLLEALLTYANDELEDFDRLKIEFTWQTKNQLVVKTTVRQLQLLTTRLFKDYKLTSEQIKEALKRYRDFLAILHDNRTKTQGVDDWHFTLRLWFGQHGKAENLQCFDEEWDRCRAEKLGLVTEETDESPLGAKSSRKASELDHLVHSIREGVYDNIQVRCGYMRVLDMSQPIELDAIYTAVNIYESISGRQRYRLTDLLEQFSLKNCTHLGYIYKERIPALTAVTQHSKLMIFGKPGSGKTTFLKWLAIQCNTGRLWENLIPVFINAKAYTETRNQPELLSYIHNQWSDCGVSPTQTKFLLKRGRVLILLDGLDEVRESDHYRILQEIREFSTQFHKCLFVMTCRIAAREYTFEQFTEVEIADFDDQQITEFVTQWFAAKNDPAKAVLFLKKLRSYQRVRDLATNPLLLTLLCLVFQEYADFSSNRSELYREGLKILLTTWDTKRSIERDGLHQGSELYQKLSLRRKEALLSHLAFTTFECGNYFIKQQDIEQSINEFFVDSPDLQDKLEAWEIDSESILKSIEAQHGLLVERARGIYSFSHLTFHEYFVAKKISSYSATQSKEFLPFLANHITDQEWREVFLLTVNMLPDADDLLLFMKNEIDGLVESDDHIQHFLSWVNERAIFEINNGRSFKPATIRAYCAFLVLNSVNTKENAFAIASAMNNTSELDRSIVNIFDTSDSDEAITFAISSAYDADRVIAIIFAIYDSMDNALSKSINRFFHLSSAIDRAISLTSNSELKLSLQELKNKLPTSRDDLSDMKKWWNEHGYSWISQLKNVQILHNNFTCDWNFSESQIVLSR